MCEFAVYIFTLVLLVERYCPKHGRTDSKILRWRDRRFNAWIRIDRGEHFDRHHRPRERRAQLNTKFTQARTSHASDGQNRLVYCIGATDLASPNGRSNERTTRRWQNASGRIRRGRVGR
jgi:hypothetical protein